MSGFYIAGDPGSIRLQARSFGNVASRTETTAEELRSISQLAARLGGENVATSGLKGALEHEVSQLRVAGEKYRKAQEILNSLAACLDDIEPDARRAYNEPCKEPGLFDFLFKGKTYPDYQQDAQAAITRAAAQIEALAQQPAYLNRGPTTWDAIVGFAQAFVEEGQQTAKDIGESVGENVAGMFQAVKFLMYDANPATVVFRRDELVETWQNTVDDAVTVLGAMKESPGQFWNGVWEATYDKELLDKNPAAWFAVTAGSALSMLIPGVAGAKALGVAGKISASSTKIGGKLGSFAREASEGFRKYLTRNAGEMGATGQLLTKALPDVKVYSVKVGTDAHSAFLQRTIGEGWSANPSLRGYGGEDASNALFGSLDEFYLPAIQNTKGIDGVSLSDGVLTVSQVKSIDPSLNSYARPSQFFGTLKSYMDDLALYDHGSVGFLYGSNDLKIDLGDIDAKQLVILLPDSGMSVEHAERLGDLVELTSHPDYEDIEIVIIEVAR